MLRNSNVCVSIYSIFKRIARGDVRPTFTCVCVYAFRPILLSLSPSHYIYQTYPLALLFFFLYKIPIRRCYERTKKTNAARFESPLGSNRSKRTHFHFQSRLFFVFFLVFFPTCVPFSTRVCKTI
jgi:hypothetical protein